MDMTVERIDHLGIIAGVIQDLNLIELIDERIPPMADENITTGEAIAGMLLCGLGFSDRPLTLTPQFFASRPIGYLLGRDLDPEYFNRFKLGRSLEEVYDYGCDVLFAEISHSVCQQEQVNQQFNHLDTTSFSVSGAYENCTDEQAIKLTYGYSRDCRPDLKQAILELVVSQDGGIPLVSQSWSGNLNDSEIFQKRMQHLIEVFKDSPIPRYLVADAKLYSDPNQTWLKQIPFLTRVPANRKDNEAYVSLALSVAEWIDLDENTGYQEFEHESGERWIVVYSQQAQQRSEIRVDKQILREAEEMTKKIRRLHRQKFACQEDAEKALRNLEKECQYHKLVEINVRAEEKHAKAGRPSIQGRKKKVTGWRVNAQLQINESEKDGAAAEGACYVLATNIPVMQMSASEVIAGYKKQRAEAVARSAYGYRQHRCCRKRFSLS